MAEAGAAITRNRQDAIARIMAAQGHADDAFPAARLTLLPGEGMAAAVRQVGAILAAHFPKDSGDPNEIPDRLIEL